MKRLLASSAIVIGLVVAPAYALQPPTTADTVIDSATVTAAPEPQTSVTIDTTVEDTPSATVETTTEVITPVSERPELDAEHPIAPEVRAIVASKKNYTTADIVQAQHEAMLATPLSKPTTIITTTTTTPKSDG